MGGYVPGTVTGLHYNTPDRYSAFLASVPLASCVDGGAGNPVFHSFACTSNSCICNSYNADLPPEAKGFWWDHGANNVNGDYIVQNCDKWVEYCKENEHVEGSTLSCQPCPAGTTRRAGDDPLLHLEGTACEVGG